MVIATGTHVLPLPGRSTDDAGLSFSSLSLLAFSTSSCAISGVGQDSVSVTGGGRTGAVASFSGGGYLFGVFRIAGPVPENELVRCGGRRNIV